MMGIRFCTVLLAWACMLLVTETTADAAETKTIKCAVPRKNADDKVTVKLKAGAVQGTVGPKAVPVTTTMTATEKATAIANALDGLRVEMHIDGYDRSVRVNASNKDANGDPTDTVTVSADYYPTTGVDVVELPFKNRSGEDADKAGAGGMPPTCGFVCVLTPPSGVSLDGMAPAVLVRTSRGSAVVTTTPIMTATQVRDALLDELHELGVTAAAVDTTAIEITFTPLDGMYLEFGTSDSGLEIEGSVRSS